MALKSVTPLELTDVQRVLLSLAPKQADGSDDPGPFTWTSDNPAVGQLVGLDAIGEPDLSNTSPSGTTAWLLTPAGPGTVNVSATSATANVDGNELQVTITEGRSGDVNLSAGTPVAD